MDINKFKNIHKGGTILLVGNGENLKDTPPENFDYPSIGMNTICLYDGWKPDYFVAVDRRVWHEFGSIIENKFEDIPKFIPTPKMLRWRGKNFYRFRNRPGPLYPKGKENVWQEINEETPVTWGNVMHVAIKLAYFMGAKTILIIGMQHKPHNAMAHFWGNDEKMTPDSVPINNVFKGYKQLVDGLHSHNVKIFNISENTYVPESVIPRDKAKNWIKKSKEIKEQDDD
jgi:hypothetical protein